jgi:hypothetical protein
MKPILFTIIFVFSLSVVASSQTIEKLSNRLALIKKSSDLSLQQEGGRLNSLVNDLHPTLYFQNGEFVKNESQEQPLVITSDAASLHKLYIENKLFKSVELLCIKVNSPDDLNTVINLSAIKGFKKLKFVYLLFTFNPCFDSLVTDSCGYSVVSKMFNGIENCNYKVFYEISISE